MHPLFTTPRLLLAATLLRLVFLLYGLYQDAHSPVKYTDIDYLVFTDAARFVARGRSPYRRATYRYTPFLAWLLLPTTWTSAPGGPTVWFSFGKLVFAVADVLAGWLMIRIVRLPASVAPVAETGRLTRKKAQQQSPPPPLEVDEQMALKYAAIWLLNPMVATISTRGSAEGLLAFLVLATLYALLRGRTVLAGALLGASVHFKIYPFIYAGTFLLYLQPSRLPTLLQRDPWRFLRREPLAFVRAQLTRDRLLLGAAALASFMALNGASWWMYGREYLRHAWGYHVSRSDHRHNFSVYHVLLYASSAAAAAAPGAEGTSWLRYVPTLAFVPQLLLSAVLLPLFLMPSPFTTSHPSRPAARARATLALPSTMLAQTLLFVAFNKVCTSQYFLWYLCLLTLHLATRRARDPSLPSRWKRDTSLAAAWVATQALWLYEGYRLEFLGESRFVELGVASVGFFAANVGLVGVVIEDVGALR